MSLDQIRTEITVQPHSTNIVNSVNSLPPPQQQAELTQQQVDCELPEHLVTGDVRVVKKIDANRNELYGMPNANIRIVNKNDIFDLQNANVDGNLGGIDMSMENESHQFGSV